MEASHIRPADASDIDSLYRIAADTGSCHERHYFERCLADAAGEKRIILVARQSDRLVGYVQLVWSPLYPPFRKLEIPEIQDLNVIPEARRRGLGGRLVAACEDLVLQTGKTDVGISVGLDPTYGAAQRLYAAKGYIPDGAGVCYDDVPVRVGEIRPIDDLLTLKLVRNLRKC